MTVSQDRPPLSRRQLRDDVTTESTEGSTDAVDPEAAAPESASAPQRTPGGRRVRWDPSAANRPVDSHPDSTATVGSDDGDPGASVDVSSGGERDGEPSSDDANDVDDRSVDMPIGADHSPAHQATTAPDLPSSGTESAPTRAPIRPRAGRRSSFAPSFPGSNPLRESVAPTSTRESAPQGGPASVEESTPALATQDPADAPDGTTESTRDSRVGEPGDAQPSDTGLTETDNESADIELIETESTETESAGTGSAEIGVGSLDAGPVVGNPTDETPQAESLDSDPTDVVSVDESVAVEDDISSDDPTTDAVVDDPTSTDAGAVDATPADAGPADVSSLDVPHPATGQLVAPERTMTRRELRALRARAEAEGRPAPDVVFLPDGGSTVTGAIDIIDPAEAQRLREERSAEAEATDATADPADAVLAHDVVLVPETATAGVVTEEPGEVVEDADPAVDEPIEHEGVEHSDDGEQVGSHEHPVADEAGVVTEERGFDGSVVTEPSTGEPVGDEALTEEPVGDEASPDLSVADVPSAEQAADEQATDVLAADVPTDDEGAGDVHADAELSNDEPTADATDTHEPTADETDTDGPPADEAAASADEPDDSDDRTPVIPALIEPPETGSIRFQPDPNADVPSEIVVDAEPVTGEFTPVGEDEPAPGPSSLRPFDAMFLPPSGRDVDGTEIDTSSVQPLNDTDGLRGDILAAPEGAARPFGHWSTQDGGDEDLAIDSLLSRDIGVSTGAVTTHALVLPSIPDAGEPLLSPLTSTGEVMVTGSVDLPRSFGSTGAHPALFDHPDVDALIDDADREDTDSGVAPVRATRAVSSTTTTRAMIGSESVPRSRWIAITAIVIGGIVLVAAATWAVAALVLNAF